MSESTAASGPPRELSYPDYETPYLEWYRGHYDCVFVAFHPFEQFAEDVAAAFRNAPSREDVVRSAKKVSWAEAGRAAGLESPERVNTALLTRIGAIREEHMDSAAAEALDAWLESPTHWAPDEGFFPELLSKDIAFAFREAGASGILGTDEFGKQAGALEVPRVEAGSVLVQDLFGHGHGCVHSKSRRFMFVVDWDSFFTLFCGPEPFVRNVVEERSLDGFFADAETSHWWSLKTVAP